ncbi:MAG TPA: hypothetical protein H9856_02395 [Candidatus Limosilactobacillus merdigallinarum]|uniref:Uncharacterized protein n=1 Tax=Candidatus Limosilactobacillus merdigallinarum TaxID=2838652 RepID=A0A9D1VH27_9LACO|nr:hypothetical protein [Candidatus Limosilactobacillus merdigallinarum]
MRKHFQMLIKTLPSLAQKQSLRDAATAKKNGELSTAEKTKKKAEQAVQSALSDAQKNAQATHDQAV